ncbi:MAG: hypothetical protein Q4B28_05510 [bacterium]|nr:hypothetical protein [bacterium]
MLKLTENTSKLLYEATKTAMYGIDGTDKWIGSKIKTNNKYMRMMKNHLLKIALVSGMLVYQGTRSDAPSTPLPDQKQPEKHLVYGIDVSHFNTFDVKKLAAENKRFRDDTDSLTHPKEFIILRATQ